MLLISWKTVYFLASGCPLVQCAGGCTLLCRQSWFAAQPSVSPFHASSGAGEVLGH